MADLRAFVGHSFSETDIPVVETFLNFFSTLQDGVMSFSWDHAKKAEPQDLKAKVLQKIEGKNVFIGICTRKEKIVTADPVRSVFGIPVGKYQFEWKTSDWIIQEIGLSIGLGLDLILLVEDGVRQPGGLQGNINYIPFCRERPHESFTQILEMLKSLSPDKPSVMVAASDSSVTQSDVPENRALPEPEWLIPKQDWEFSDFELAIFWAIIKQDNRKEEEIGKAFDENKLAGNVKLSAEWEAKREYLRIAHGTNGRIVNLKALALKHPNNYEVLSNLASAYAKFENYTDSAHWYKAAAAIGETPPEVIHSLKEAALNLYADGKFSEVLKVCDEIRGRGAEEGDELSVLNALKDIYEKAERHIAVLSIRERLAELNPDSADERFSLGYEHSQYGGRDLALYHYEMIPDQHRSAMAYNNIGVSYAAFKLPARSVAALEKAKELRETLAMSNLAYRYIDAGFLGEARAECDEAMKEENYHNNVNLALARLAAVEEEEVKKENEILNGARTKSEFLKRHGLAMTRKRPDKVYETWNHQKYGRLDLVIRGEELEATGSYKIKGNALLGLAGPMVGERTAIVKISGKIFGRAAECSLNIDDGTPKGIGLLSGLDTSRVLLMYLSDDGNTWNVVEEPFSENSQAYVLLASLG